MIFTCSIPAENVASALLNLASQFQRVGSQWIDLAEAADANDMQRFVEAAGAIEAIDGGMMVALYAAMSEAGQALDETVGKLAVWEAEQNG